VLRKYLYKSSTQKKQSRLYGLLSARSHASMQSAFSDMFYNKRVYEDTLKVIFLLSISNIVVIWEVFTDTILKNSNTELEELTDTLCKQLGSVPLLIPDSKDCINRIKIIPY
jgi:hypothetical protein